MMKGRPMRTLLIPLLLLSAAPLTAQAQMESAPMTESTVQQSYADILSRRIETDAQGLNRFDYAGADAAGELAAITAYTDALAALNAAEMSEAEATAYWANLYNALTLKVVLENYPVKSIRKIKSGAFSMGPWKRDAITVQGQTLSLDDIEHEILRVDFASPYIHYMVNCASVGCPNLMNRPWTAETMEADRKQAARDFINSPRGVVVDGDELTVSSIYKWFDEDFGGSKTSVLAHIREHADADLAAAIDAGAKIDGYDYNWSLNE